MTGTVDPTSDRPVFRQIADLLRDDIQSGRLTEGARLPSERDLMDAYGAARGTVRQAVALLRTEGLIHTEHGRGGFVRSRPPVKRIAHDRFARRHREEGKAAFLAEAEAEGISPGVEVLKVGPEVPPAEIAERLDVPANEKVLVRRRRYLADGDPVEMATSYLPLAIAQGTAIAKKNPGPGGIYARLEESGHQLARFTEEVSARMPSPDEVRSLRLNAGTPVFGLVRTAYDESGRAVEVCDTVMAADRFVLSYGCRQADRPSPHGARTLASRSPAVSPRVMPDVDMALTSLAERGYWTHPPFPTSEVFRVELSDALPAVRALRVRTGVNGDGFAWACTPDGMPAEEPWRGAAKHARASGVYDDLARDALDRMVPSDDT